MSDVQWAQWPQGIPLPTASEWSLAEQRHRIYHDRQNAILEAEGRPYQGDCGYSLAFDMATCSANQWLRFFFPDGIS